MNTPKPAPHLIALADDNQLGISTVLSLLLTGPGIAAAMDWSFFFGLDHLPPILLWPMTLIGLTLLASCVRRLLRPGCRIILRINHGGLTDFRLSGTPFQWKDIHQVSRLSGRWTARLPILLLDISPATLPLQDRTLWFRLLHWPLHRRKTFRVILLCGSLDNSTEIIQETIQDHLTQKNVPPSL